MIIQKEETGYKMWLSANNTNEWRRGNWPCSSIGGCRIFVAVDENGLYDFTVNGNESTNIDGNELDAIVSDFLPADLHDLWPIWGSEIV